MAQVLRILNSQRAVEHTGFRDIQTLGKHLMPDDP